MENSKTNQPHKKRKPASAAKPAQIRKNLTPVKKTTSPSPPSADSAETERHVISSADLEPEKPRGFKRLASVFHREPKISEIVREPTSGGIVFRYNEEKTDIEVLLIEDSKNRWTIPKGHIEPGETARVTARREIAEETGLKNVNLLTWLGKVQFKYRRGDKLVLMTTQVYLVESLDRNEKPVKERWMKNIRWFSFADALEAVEYDDVAKLLLLGKKKLRTGDY